MPFLDDPILGAIVPWFCDKLGSDLSVKDCRRDLSSFWLRMKDQGVDPLSVTGDHVRIYKNGSTRRRSTKPVPAVLLSRGTCR